MCLIIQDNNPWPQIVRILGSDVSGCRYMSDYRSRGREFDPGPVSSFHGDWS